MFILILLLLSCSTTLSNKSLDSENRTDGATLPEIAVILEKKLASPTEIAKILSSTQQP